VPPRTDIQEHGLPCREMRIGIVSKLCHIRPESQGQHGDLRGHAEVDRCCGKSLIGCVGGFFYASARVKRTDFQACSFSARPLPLLISLDRGGTAAVVARDSAATLMLALPIFWRRRRPLRMRLFRISMTLVDSRSGVNCVLSPLFRWEHSPAERAHMRMNATQTRKRESRLARDFGTTRFGSEGTRSKNSWRNSALRSSVPTLI